MYICLFLYILALADKTTGPNWLKFFEGTHGYPFFSVSKIPRATAGTSAGKMGQYAQS